MNNFVCGWGTLKSEDEMLIPAQDKTFRTVRITGLSNCQPVCQNTVIYAGVMKSEDEISLSYIDDVPTVEAVELSGGDFLSFAVTPDNKQLVLMVRSEDVKVTKNGDISMLTCFVGGIGVTVMVPDMQEDYKDHELLCISSDSFFINRNAREVQSPMASVSCW